MTDPQLRVLDLSDSLTFQGTRLLVGLGADVVRIESSNDDAMETAQSLHWHSGKRVVTTSSDEEYDTAVTALLPGADVVLESGPFQQIRTLELRAKDPAAWAHVAHVVTTPFGLSGPRRDWLADDVVLASAGGMSWLGGDPGQAPEPPPREQALHVVGAQAALGAFLALTARNRTGRGQLVEISAQEAVASTLETGALQWIHADRIPQRNSGVYNHVAHRVFAATDGHLAGGYSGSPRMWEDLLAWLVEEDEAEDLSAERWRDPDYRWANRAHVDEVLERFSSRRKAADLADEARRRRLPWAQITPPADLPENPQLRERRFFVGVETADETVTDIGFPLESPALPRPIRLPAPRYAPRWDWRPLSGTARTGATTRVRRPAPRADGPERSTAALAGVRVLDLTWVLAGPYATKTFADFGAEVIKVESFERKDPTRFSPGMLLRPGASHEESGYFMNFNRNKLSLSLNLRTDAGRALLRRLVGEVDVVVENFSPGVLDRWGLSFPELQKINPDVILVSMSGVGHTGPWRSAVTFADTLSAMSGITFDTGRADRAPQGLAFGLGDMVAANSAALGALHLLHAGVGGHVELSQLEAMAAQLGTAVIESQLPSATEHRGPLPGIFRAQGDDRWLAIGDARLDDVLTALDAPSGDSDQVGAAARAIRRLDADDVATRLQRHGVPAYPVRDGRDLVDHDDQLQARDFYPRLTHPRVGSVAHESFVPRLSETPGGLWTAAPLLGEHTDDVLARLLDLDDDQIHNLRKDGVLR